MKKISKAMLLLALFCFLGAMAWGEVVSFDFPAATNGAAYTVPVGWQPKVATANGAAGNCTVSRIHGVYTNSLGTVASNASQSSVTRGYLVPGDVLVFTGTGTIEVQGEK